MKSSTSARCGRPRARSARAASRVCASLGARGQDLGGAADAAQGVLHLVGDARRDAPEAVEALALGDERPRGRWRRVRSRSTSTAPSSGLGVEDRRGRDVDDHVVPDPPLDHRCSFSAAPRPGLEDGPRQRAARRARGRAAPPPGGRARPRPRSRGSGRPRRSPARRAPRRRPRRTPSSSASSTPAGRAPPRPPRATAKNSRVRARIASASSESSTRWRKRRRRAGPSRRPPRTSSGWRRASGGPGRRAPSVRRGARWSRSAVRAVGLARRSPRASARVCAKIHGLPIAPRPIITPAAPVSRSISKTSLRLHHVAVGEDRRTGHRLHHAADDARSARPVYCWARVRPCTLSSSAPSATAMRANSGALMERVVPARSASSPTACRRKPARMARTMRGRARQIAQQRRAGAVADELLHRAAHVQVDPVDALAARRRAGLAEDLRLRAEELERDRRLARRGREQAAGLAAAASPGPWR